MAFEKTSNPVFNIKAVSERTGIPPVTLRAWERRHGYPKPQRTETGYRLYSEHDVAALNWLKMQTKSGLSIGRAVKLLQGLWDRGENPLSIPVISPELMEYEGKSLEDMRNRLIDSLIDLDDQTGGQILRTAFNIYPIESVLLEFITPVMVTLGQKWHDGEISIATEHFATQQCRLYLMNALESLHVKTRRGLIVAACAPTEWHDIGLIMMTILLRLREWNVVYLGQNTSLDRLGETLASHRPNMMLFSATSVQAAEKLTALNQVLDEIPEPKPVIGLGGQAFLMDPTLTNRVPGTFFGTDAREAITLIERTMKKLID